MNVKRIILPIAMLVGATMVNAMDADDVLRRVGHAADGGINIQQATMPINRIDNLRQEHHHAMGEHVHMAQHQQYNPREGFRRQMLYSYLSGIKEMVFNAGNIGSNFFDYIERLAAAALVDLSVNGVKKAWNYLTTKKNGRPTDAEKQKALESIAVQDALLNNIASQLRALPRTTEAEKETFAQLHAQYVAMFKRFTQHATDYMSMVDNSKQQSA